jgi:hypothetical protein
MYLIYPTLVTAQFSGEIGRSAMYLRIIPLILGAEIHDTGEIDGLA